MSARIGKQTILIAVLLAISALSFPTLAKAQNRGTMQVSARVVDSRIEIQALDAARAATARWASASPQARLAGLDHVTTVAQVSVTPTSVATPAGRQVSGLLVTIDYSKN